MVQISSDFYINYQEVLKFTLSQSHLHGETAVHFLQLNAFTQYKFLFQLVPITACWPEAVGIQSLPKAFTHEQRCGSNLRYFDLGSNALTTRPCVPLLSERLRSYFSLLPCNTLK